MVHGRLHSRSTVCIGHSLAAVAFLLTVSAQAQTLSVTNNLTLWLKPESLSLTNGAAVNFWGDSSTNQNDAVALNGGVAPTYVVNGINGRPSVVFDGTSDYLSLTNKVDPLGYGQRVHLPSGLTMIAVFRTTSADTVRSFEGNPAQTIIGDNTGATYSEFGLQGAKPEYNHYVSNWTNYIDGTTALNNTNGVPGHYILVTHRTSDGLVNLYADGSLEATATRTYQTTYTGINRISGGYTGATSDLFNGMIAEVLVYNGALSDVDRISVQNYLNFKYAIPEPTIGVLSTIGLLALIRRTRSKL